MRCFLWRFEVGLLVYSANGIRLKSDISELYNDMHDKECYKLS